MDEVAVVVDVGSLQADGGLIDDLTLRVWTSKKSLAQIQKIRTQ